MKYSCIPLAQSVVQHCMAKGVANIVISPGSRNAPLTISFTENPFFNCYSIVDERCAAFFALGMALQLQQPVAVVCTSGSALLNYYPAVAEAFYSQIPLVVISADRPPYKIDVGDGQTIRQDNVFNRHIGYAANLKQDVIHATEKIKRYRPDWLSHKKPETVQKEIQAFNDTEMNKALNKALTSLMPVHINVPFEEPLYDFLSEASVMSNVCFDETIVEELPNLEEVKELWGRSKRKMVLVGVHQPNSVTQQLLNELGGDPSVLVLTETTSNLHHPNFFNSIDTIIAPIEFSQNTDTFFQQLQPDILITFGGLIVSKKIKAFLRSYTPKYHWHIGGKRANDTFFCLKEHFKITVNDFIGRLYEDEVMVKSDYFTTWDNVKTQYKIRREEYLEQIPFSDFLVFNTILKNIPNAYQLHLANSSTIRYTQLFELHPSLKVFCNRGTSGIDGSTSTAVGASQFENEPTILITGDLSFFYDSNALWNSYLRNDFRIILINNEGGGIFRILPGKEDTDNFERFFETKHQLEASKLCAMYGLDYFCSSDEASLLEILNGFYEQSKKPKLLEINTPRLKNNKILMDYFHFIS